MQIWLVLAVSKRRLVYLSTCTATRFDSLDCCSHVTLAELFVCIVHSGIVQKCLLGRILLLLLFYGPLSGTTWVSRYRKRSPTHTYQDHQLSFICFFHLLRSIASSLFNLRARQSFCTTSVQVFFGLPLGQAPSTSQHVPIQRHLYGSDKHALICYDCITVYVPF